MFCFDSSLYVSASSHDLQHDKLQHNTTKIATPDTHTTYTHNTRATHAPHLLHTYFPFVCLCVCMFPSFSWCYFPPGEDDYDLVLYISRAYEEECAPVHYPKVGIQETGERMTQTALSLSRSVGEPFFFLLSFPVQV